MNTVVNEKKKFRDRIRSELKQIEHSKYEEMNTLLSEKVFQFLTQKNVYSKEKVIGAYAPFEKEPIWFLVVENKAMELSFPSFDLQNDQMIFRKSKLNELEVLSDFGVKILGPNLKNQIVEPDILFIPGIAFSLSGDRLGRGKGYYDKYLQRFQGVKVGIAFEMQIFDSIPNEEHDQKLDWIITEKNIYKF